MKCHTIMNLKIIVIIIAIIFLIAAYILYADIRRIKKLMTPIYSKTMLLEHHVVNLQKTVEVNIKQDTKNKPREKNSDSPAMTVSYQEAIKKPSKYQSQRINTIEAADIADQCRTKGLLADKKAYPETETHPEHFVAENNITKATPESNNELHDILHTLKKENRTMRINSNSKNMSLQTILADDTASDAESDANLSDLDPAIIQSVTECINNDLNATSDNLSPIPKPDNKSESDAVSSIVRYAEVDDDESDLPKKRATPPKAATPKPRAKPQAKPRAKPQAKPRAKPRIKSTGKSTTKSASKTQRKA